MIKIENFEVVGWEHAFRGMRNPKNSWAKSDSSFHEKAVTEALDYSNNPDGEIKELLVQFDALDIGEKDHELAMKLVKGGPVHAKFRRMIAVYVDVTAPLYWWKEYDTYKVGTVANSCSTMHKIHEKEFTFEDFSRDHFINIWDFDPEVRDLAPTIEADVNTDVACHYVYGPIDVLTLTINMLNRLRELYIKTNDKYFWYQMIQLLPSSYNQKRTLMLNYEVLANIYKWRKNHKLQEWVDFCNFIKNLPYSEIITGSDADD